MRWKRIAAVTAGLMVAGGLFGTLAGMLVLLAWGSASDAFIGFRMDDAVMVLQFSMVFGGVPGAVLGPLAAWGLMRHVPLGLAVGGTTLGTLVGGGIGLALSGNPWIAMWYGMASFALTAAGLRIRVARQRRLTSG